jgi:hypothetical protein
MDYRQSENLVKMKNKASGTQVIQDLQFEAVFGIRPYEAPTGADKIERTSFPLSLGRDHLQTFSGYRNRRFDKAFTASRTDSTEMASAGAGSKSRR